MQKNLVLERKQKQYIIRSTTTGENNAGIDVDFVRAVHRNLLRMYQLYTFVFARGKRAIADAQNADYVVKIESGTKRQSEQYALFYALEPALYAKTVFEAMGLGATAADYEDYALKPFSVCAASDMQVLTEKLSGIRCRTQKDFLASMRVLCRAVVCVETPYNMTIDVKNEADMETVLDYTQGYFLSEEEETPDAPVYNMFGSDLPAPVGFAGGINKRTDAFSTHLSGITPLMGDLPKAPAPPVVGAFAASVPFEGDRVHADAFGKLVLDHDSADEQHQNEEELDVTTVFDENAVFIEPKQTAPAPKPRKKKQRTSPFWIGHEDELNTAAEAEKADESVVYEADALPYFVQTVEELVAEEPPVVHKTVEKVVEEVPAAPEKKVPRETLILPGNVIDIFESAGTPQSTDASSDESGIMAYTFDYFADHSVEKKRERVLKSPFEAGRTSQKMETTIPDAHIDDLLVRPTAKPAEETAEEPKEATVTSDEKGPADTKQMFYIPVNGMEIALLAEADTDKATLLEEARRIAAQIYGAPEEAPAAVVKESVEETVEEPVAEEMPVVAEIEETVEETAVEETPVVVEIEEPVEEEPVVAEIEKTVEEADTEQEPFAVEIEETIEEEAAAEETPIVVEIEKTVEEADTEQEPFAVEIEETVEETAVEETPVVVEIEESVEEPVAEEMPVVVEIEETVAETAVEEAPVVAEIKESVEETVEEPVAEETPVVAEIEESVEEPIAEEAPASAAINVPLFYSHEAQRAELDDELDEMFEELRRPAPAPQISELDAIMMELEQGQDTRATAVLPAQDLIWKQEEEARAVARQVEEEFAQALVQHSVETARQTMQEQDHHDNWIDIDMIDTGKDDSTISAMEDVLQVEDPLFSAEENFSQEYVEAAQEAEIQQEPAAIDRTVQQTLIDDTQTAEDAAPYAYDVEVLVADEVSPQEADRIVEDYRRAVGVETEDPWLQVQQQWNIPEPQPMVDGEPVDPNKAEHIRKEADAIADELESAFYEEEMRIDPAEADEEFAARSAALYDQLRVMPADYTRETEEILPNAEESVEESAEPDTEDDIEIELYEMKAEETADDYEVILLDAEETAEVTAELDAEDDVAIELDEPKAEESADDYEVILLDAEETAEVTAEPDTEDDVAIELDESEREESADDYEVIVLDAEEPVEVTAEPDAEDDVAIELDEPKAEESADDYEVILLDAEEPAEVTAEPDTEDDVAIELDEPEREESADDYEVILLDAEEPAEVTAEPDAEDDVAIELDEPKAEESADDYEIIVLDEEPIEQAEPEQTEEPSAEEQDEVVLDPETALRARIMREMPESLRNSPMAGRAAELLATMYRVDADTARIDRQMAALNPQLDEDETRAIYGRTSVEEELPEDFDLYHDAEKAEAQADVIELGGEVDETYVVFEEKNEETKENAEGTPIVTDDLFIRDDVESMDLPEQEVVSSDVRKEETESAQADDLDAIRAIARDIYEQYDAMDEEEPVQEVIDESSAAEETVDAQDVDDYSPMDDARQYFVPSAVEMELEEEGYPGEIYDEHLLAYAAQAEEIEAFDRRMQEEYRRKTAEEETETAADVEWEDASDYEIIVLDDEADFGEDYEEAPEEDADMEFDGEFDENFDEAFDDGSDGDAQTVFYREEADDGFGDDVFIEGVDDVIDELPESAADMTEPFTVESADEYDAIALDEEFSQEAPDAQGSETEDGGEFDDTLIDEPDEEEPDAFAIEEARLAEEQARLEREIAEQERLIAESRASRAQLDEIAAELDRSIARENLAAQRAARQQLEREKFERTQRVSQQEIEQANQEYQYAQVGEPLAHRAQGKRIARHRNKRWF